MRFDWFYCVFFKIVATTVEANSAILKSKWEATASSVFDPATNDPSLAIDGAVGFQWHNSEDALPHSWIQIKMDKEHWVKGVKIILRANYGDRMSFIEVPISVLLIIPLLHFKRWCFQIRVGNIDVSGSSEDELLCQNELCTTTGNAQVVGHLLFSLKQQR